MAIWNHDHQNYVRMTSKRVEKYGGYWRNPFPSSWDYERFVPVMAGNGEIALHNTKWNRFVRMNDQGKIDRSAAMNRDRIHNGMTWERFKVVATKKGYIALYNMHFGRFIKMDWHTKDMVVSPKINWWDLPDNWVSEAFFFTEVGEKKNCNFWCRLRKGIEKAVDRIASWVKKLLQCFGDWTFSTTVGYNREIGTNAAVSFGISGTASHSSSNKIEKMRTAFRELLVEHAAPSIGVSIHAGLSAGVTTKFLWSGVGVSLWVSCSAKGENAGCTIGISVGAIFTAWSLAGADANCLFGPTIFGAFDCSRSAGGTFLLICCSYTLTSGTNNCR